MHDELHAKWKRLEAEAERLSAIAHRALEAGNAAWREAHLAELALLEAEDRAACPRAAWIEAHLEGRHEDAQIALAAMYPESETAQEAARRVRACRERPQLREGR